MPCIVRSKEMPTAPVRRLPTKRSSNWVRSWLHPFKDKGRILSTRSCPHQTTTCARNLPRASVVAQLRHDLGQMVDAQKITVAHQSSMRVDW